MASRWPSWQTHALFWPIAAGGIALDLWTKKAMFERLGPNDHIDVVPGFLRLVTALNEGAAFGLASGKRPILIGVSIVALIVILGLFLLGGKKPALMTIALALFAGGICGNLYDRAFNGGRVRDFIDVYIGNYRWPTFNVADTLLCVAVGLLMIAAWTTGRPDQRRDQPQR